MRSKLIESNKTESTCKMANDTSPQSDRSVKDYIASLKDEQTVTDCQVLLEMMQRISGHEPKPWNMGTIGFDNYHYTYDSGRQGAGHMSI